MRIDRGFFLLFTNLFLHLVDVGVDAGYGNNVDDVADGSSEVDEVYGLVQPHLDRTDNLDVAIQHL